MRIDLGGAIISGFKGARWWGQNLKTDIFFAPVRALESTWAEFSLGIPKSHAIRRGGKREGRRKKKKKEERRTKNDE